MAHFIFIEEGTYQIDEAFLMTPAYSATVMEQALVEVYLGEGGERRLRGSGFAVNALLVELLEDHDDIDMLMDLGGEFKYVLKTPIIKGGKVFSPDVKSLIHFEAQSPAQRLTSSEFQSIRSRLTVIGSQ